MNKCNARLRLAAAGLAWLTVLAGGRGVCAQAASPDLSPGADRFPGADGVMLRWEQSWTLDKDGTVHRRDHQWFKLFNVRPIGRFGDQRLDFNDAQDELIIHTARTHQSNGTVLPVPKYSFNLAGPDDVAGWPAYAPWRQMVVCFSGIEPNAVIEMDYEVTTKPGVIGWINADLRLHDDYPTIQRIINVTVPAGVQVRHRLDGLTGGPTTSSDAGGVTTYRWVFADLPGSPAEPQSPPWPQRNGRLCFTTCPTALDWATALLQPAERAAQPADNVTALATKAVEGKVDPIDRIQAVSKAIRDSFNFVSSWKTRQPLTCRPAGEVLRSNYGNELESAALLAAALRGLGMETELTVAVDSTIWDKDVPADSAFAGLVAAVALPDQIVWVHPRQGVIRNPGSWGRHRLLSVTGDRLTDVCIRACGEGYASEFQLGGKITIDKSGKAGGELRLRLTGSFYNPAGLESASAQASLVKGLVQRALSGFTVSGHTLTTLSDDVLEAKLTVSSGEALPEVGGQRVLRFGDGPAFLGDFPLPLSRSYRQTDVDLAGAFREQVDILVELPEGQAPVVVPAGLPKVEAGWGSVAQSVDADGRTVRVRRTVEVTADPVPAKDFEALRSAVNDLRATQSLLLAIGSAPTQK
ncbi:MAG TPA: DUF3857 domain-containing protein [Phycisphaerae bacterium]|nr:DUF3857 domain-containing protein [Phycisphaerae bacterium]HNU45169.1 DUF3857 domain-containing protein [Phycisphaerae bacterium]